MRFKIDLWKNIFMTLTVIALGALLFAFLVFVLSEKKVVAYELGGNPSYLNGYYVNVNVDFAQDTKFDLVNVSFEEAVILVEKLNKTLKQNEKEK